MTIRELTALRHIDAEIREIKEAIAELETAATSTTAQITGMPSGGSISDKVGTYAVLIADYTNMLSAAQQRMIIESKRLHEYILTIEDAETRRIFFHRFIKGESWVRVATRIGGGNTASGVRMRAYRFIKKGAERK